MSEEVKEVKLHPAEQLETVKRIAKECSKFTAGGTLDHLQRGGFKSIGAGWFSEVLLHPMYDNYVIKVCTRAGDSWPMYAKYCRDNKDNPEVNFLLPVIHEFIQINERGLYVAVLDRLERADDYNQLHWNKLNAEQLDQALAIGAGMQTEKIGYGLDYHCKQRRDCAFRRDMTQKATYKQPDYKKAGRMIFDDLRLFCTIDLHGGNVMLCPKTGNVIVTDPVSYSSSNEKVEEVRAALDPSYKPVAHPEVKERKGYTPSANSKRLNPVLGHELLGFDFAKAELRVAAFHVKAKMEARQHVDKKQPSARHRHQCTFIRQKIHKHKRF